jgi:two-component system response regulator
VPKTEGAKHFVLLVEDNEDDERLTLRALKDTYPAPRVEVARDGEQALSYLSRWPSEGESEHQIPSLVLLDLKLPKISGQEVLKAFRAHAPLQDVPIVIVTSSENEMDIRSVWEMGASDYMKKPMDYCEYLSAVESVARMWLPEYCVL